MAAMKAKRMVNELCLVAERLGLEVRREALDGAPGGLCRLKGRRLILVDTALAVDAQAEVLAAALTECARADGDAALDDVFILPEVRQFLQDCAGDR
jgi:hypothetical protein